MVKSFKEPSSATISRDKKDKLLQLMDKSKISLLRASQLLDIPYNTAKQILFIYSTPRKHLALQSITPTSARSIGASSPELKTAKTSLTEKKEKVRKSSGYDVKMKSHKTDIKPKALFCNTCSCAYNPYTSDYMRRPNGMYGAPVVYQPPPPAWSPYPYYPAPAPYGVYAPAPWPYYSIPPTYPATPMQNQFTYYHSPSARTTASDKHVDIKYQPNYTPSSLCPTPRQNPRSPTGLSGKSVDGFDNLSSISATSTIKALGV